jgi:hypothetical protein
MSRQRAVRGPKRHPNGAGRRSAGEVRCRRRRRGRSAARRARCAPPGRHRGRSRDYPRTDDGTSDVAIIAKWRYSRGKPRLGGAGPNATNGSRRGSAGVFGRPDSVCAAWPSVRAGFGGSETDGPPDVGARLHPDGLVRLVPVSDRCGLGGEWLGGCGPLSARQEPREPWRPLEAGRSRLGRHPRAARRRSPPAHDTTSNTAAATVSASRPPVSATIVQLRGNGCPARIAICTRRHRG